MKRRASREIEAIEKVGPVVAGFVKDETGAAAVEYSLIIGTVSLLIVFGAIILGGSINLFFTNLGDWFTTLTGNLPDQPEFPGGGGGGGEGG
jgi:Flp pilus assembly pilin Flp